ncbi:family 20 glycosylhydrolase [Nocardiopsis sp. HNM0947]|uniref:beta-N-acetylhexosaminidase n=2 Tax=Nocardiopsis coralli TaxID=2772213 RepID=A0ABR9PAK8_9ACTN|nr:family 20 glycosylhydrolase [Nocardiopsis coralli]
MQTPPETDVHAELPRVVPAPFRDRTAEPVRVGVGGRLTLAGADPEAADWFTRSADRLHGLRVEAVRENAGVRVFPAADPAEFAAVAPATGVDPRPVPGADERHALEIAEDRIVVRAAGAEGAFRALTSLVQLLTVDAAGGVWAPRGTVVDGPRYTWRSLSLDVVRHWFTVQEVRRVVDLMALYKFNVLHLHLTDSQGWSLESRRWPELTRPRPDGTRRYYTREEFAGLVAHAAHHHVTVVPEVDLPGHTGAAFDAYPELHGDIPPIHPRARFLHPDSEAALGFARDVLEEFAELTPGRFLHLGGDEPFGMLHDDYVRFVEHTHRSLRATGKRAVGWQETARAGVLDGEDVLQYWIGAPDEFDAEGIKAQVPPEYHAVVDRAAESFRISPGDAPAAVRAGVPVLVAPNSRLYLDRSYADACADPAQENDRERLGLPAYEPITVADTFAWDPDDTAESAAPGACVAGVEAAVWGETMTGFDDLAFLLLPRLPGVAEKAWTRRRTEWAGHRRSLAAHRAFWDALGFGNHFRPAD